MLFYIYLNFLLKFFRSFRALCKNDIGFYNLASDFIRCSNNRTFKNIRKFHDNAFDFEGSDTVSGRFDNIIDSADIPIESVFIFPSCVTCMIVSVMPYFFGLFFVFEISLEEAVWNFSLCIDDNLSCFPWIRPYCSHLQSWQLKVLFRSVRNLP